MLIVIVRENSIISFKGANKEAMVQPMPLFPWEFLDIVVKAILVAVVSLFTTNYLITVSLVCKGGGVYNLFGLI